MSFLEEMQNIYGDNNYKRTVNSLKKKIKNVFELGDKSYCVFETISDNMDKLIMDPEFEGFKFKDSVLSPTNKGNVVKLVCWD